jgi:sarcosine oxidase
VPLVVTRQVLGWVWPKEPDLFDISRCPVWAIDDGTGQHFYYGFPMTPDNPGVKLARHFPASPVDPDSVNRNPLAADEDSFRPCLSRFMPAADGPLLSMRICLYTNSPDGHFIVDQHPVHDRVTIACGFSGHGFKFAPVIGQALAEMAADGGTALPIGFLGLKRFRK